MKDVLKKKPMNSEFTYDKSSLLWRKSVSSFLREPCCPYDSMLFEALVETEIRPYVREVTNYRANGQGVIRDE